MHKYKCSKYKQALSIFLALSIYYTYLGSVNPMEDMMKKNSVSSEQDQIPTWTVKFVIVDDGMV